MPSSFWNKSRIPPGEGEAGDAQPLPSAVMSECDAIITPNEASERHGIGIIVDRFFGGFPNTLSIRSQNSFGGVQKFGTRKLLVSHAGLARWESFGRMLKLLNGSTVGRVLCVPFFTDDLISAVCLKELFNAPLCVYVMDDNNIGARGIPDHVFAEALGKADLRLGISPEIRDAYQEKFGEEFFVLPPLVDGNALLREPEVPQSLAMAGKAGVLIGNVWSQKWLARLRQTLRESGLKVHWYGNTNAKWLKYGREELEADGITTFGFLPEPELISRLRAYPFAIIPSGSLDEQDDRPELARLSLPSRIIYLAAVANLPLLVLGSPATSAGNFVRKFEIGMVCPYEGAALKCAARALFDPDEQWHYRRNASRIGEDFTLDNPGQWIWDSLEKKAPVDDRFEKLMPK